MSKQKKFTHWISFFYTFGDTFGFAEMSFTGDAPLNTARQIIDLHPFIDESAKKIVREKTGVAVENISVTLLNWKLLDQ